MLQLEKITGKNVWDILKLCVSEKQKNLSQFDFVFPVNHNG